MAITIRDDAAAGSRAPQVRNEVGQPTFEITIDGRKMRAYEGQTVLSVAEENGILDIPNLCNDEKLEPTSACRMCLVEIENTERPLPSCNTPAAPGMVVRTKSDRLQQIRKTNLEMMLSDHNAYCQPPCQIGCPTHIDIPGYLELIAKGENREAARLVKEVLPVPVYPRPDLPRAVPGGLPPRTGGGRDRHLPHARLRGGAGAWTIRRRRGCRRRRPARRSRSSARVRRG